MEQIVRGELAEREAAAGDYDRSGRPERAEQLRSEARVISALLSTGGRQGCERERSSAASGD
jgi:hypothetical protein